MAKTPCTVTRPEFVANAADVVLQLMSPGGALVAATLVANPKVFSTGSVGWNHNGKLTLKLANGQSVVCQVGLNITVVGSKELPKDELYKG